MPNPMDFTDEKEWMGACVPKMMDEGKDNGQAVAACTNMWQMKGDAGKYRASLLSVKAVGDWELDVTPVPFKGTDSDGQYFDANTDIMEHSFSTPLVVYQHGIKQGAREMEDKPIIIGKSTAGTLEKQSDGWHIRVVLDKARQEAARIMNSARKGAVAVSSDSISHLARLDVGGKLIQYQKNKAGRIAVWPLAGFSLWELGSGNLQPASRNAVALPAMKAIYRDAGLPFPEIMTDTYGAAQADMVARRAKVAQENAREILRKYK